MRQATILALIALATLLLGSRSHEAWPGYPELTRLARAVSDPNFTVDNLAHFTMCDRPSEAETAVEVAQFCYVPPGSTFTIKSFGVLYLGTGTGDEENCELSLRSDTIGTAEGDLISGSTIDTGDEGDNDGCVNQAANYTITTRGDYCLRQFSETLTGPMLWRVHAVDNDVGGAPAKFCDNLTDFFFFVNGVAVGY